MSNAPVESYSGPVDSPVPPLPSVSSQSSDFLKAIPEMQRTPRLCWSILLSALVFGVVANLLFRNAAGIGFNALLVALVFYGGWFYLARERAVAPWRKYCAVAALLYAAALSVRASEILYGINLALLVGFSALACSPVAGGAIRSVVLIAVGLLQVGVNALIGALLLGAEIPWKRVKPNRETGSVCWRIITGLIIAVPFLLIFGSLFSRADGQFQLICAALFSQIFDTFFANLGLTLLFFFLALGLLRSSFFSRLTTVEQLPMVKQRIGLVESTTVLVLLNVLFVIFIATQLRYLFGGQIAVSASPDLVWSTYARRGFFELATVVALIVPTLMLFTNLTRTSTARQRKLLAMLCAMLSAFTGIVIVSAFQRMMLYTANFGLSELRIYVSTFIVMLALILILLNVFHVMGRTGLFFPASLCVGVLFSLGIQVPNIQGMVAGNIISRYLTGQNGDMEYLKRLSTDAVPVILNSELPPKEQQEACVGIFQRSGLRIKNRVVAHDPSWLYYPVSTLRAFNRFAALQ